MKSKQLGGRSQNQVLVEKGEVFQDDEGTIQQVSKNAPSHDDGEQINKFGIKSTSKGNGGVVVNANSVLSDSHSQVQSGKRKNSEKEEVVKIKQNEGEAIAATLGLNIKLKRSLSPSALFLQIQSAKDKEALKILKASDKAQKTKESANSLQANSSTLLALPSDEEIYHAIFDIQETNKENSGIDFEETTQSQYGGSNSILSQLNLL